MPLLPKSKSGQLVDLLRNRLATGDWQDQLPPERLLAEEYLVSRTTLRRALAALVRGGQLSPANSTRSGCKPTGARSRRGAVTTTHAVLLTPSLAGVPVLLEQLAFLRERLGPAGIRVQTAEAGALVNQKSPDAGLKRMVAGRPGAMWILHRMPAAVQRFFAGTGVPTVIFGSSFEEAGLPSIDVDFTVVARHAVGLCMARGLHRLTLLLHRTNLAGDELIVEAVARELRRHNAPPPRILRHDFNRARLIDTLDATMVPANSRGDALLISSQHHLLTTHSHLLRRGIRFPADLSLLYLSNDPVIECLSPLPCRYDSGTELVRKLAAAVTNLAAGIPVTSVRVLPKLRMGETLRPR